MSAGSVSLESALRTCKVNTAWATRIESDRFFNPNNLVCPIWNGMDGTGREVCKDSYYNKSAGCNSATDRVNVENDISRPHYMEYITLSANGIAGDIYGKTDAYKNAYVNYQVTLQKDKSYEIKYRPFNISDYIETGTWDFSSDKLYINFTPKDSKSPSKWKILRLTENETWVIQNINGKDVELRMKD